MQTVKINEPVEITRKDIENYVKMKFYTELTLIKEKLTLFEKKYNCDFPQFEKSINEAEGCHFLYNFPAWSIISWSTGAHLN